MKIKQIYLIDDDAEDVEIFLEALDSLNRGYLHSAAINPINALKELKDSDKRPDIIFVDINMPCMNGYEFLRSVRNTSGLNEVPVVLMSNPHKEFVIPKIRQYDKVGYLTKPASFGTLKSSLKKLLDLADEAS